MDSKLILEGLRYGYPVTRESPYYIVDGASLLAAIDLLESQRWMPVSERLPEYGKWIVGRRRGRRPFTCRYIHVPDRFGGYTEFRDADGLVRDPTEWFPLPESLSDE